MRLWNVECTSQLFSQTLVVESDEVDEDDGKIGQRSEHRHDDGTGYTSTKFGISIADVYPVLTIEHSDC